RGQRKPLVAIFVRAPLCHLVETPEQAFEVVRDQLAMRPRQVIHTFVDRAERARATLFVEIAAEALGSAPRACANELRELFLFGLAFSHHDRLRRREFIVTQPSLTRAIRNA